MEQKKIIERLIPNALKRFYQKKIASEDISKFEFSFMSPSDVKADIQKKYNHDGELVEFFSSNKEHIVHKWHHYIPLYDRYFSSYRGGKVRFLEIGVSKGGSLQMWRNYFGDDAVIFGIDINPDCEKFNNKAGQVRIGSQIDERFLKSVITEMGGVDIVLDDGSHHMQHIPATLKHLFPILENGGVYMIEDLHTSYWKNYGGGYNGKNNFFRVIMQIIDDMHHWYHKMGMKNEVVSKSCSGIHIHDSIVVLEKNKTYEPVHSQNG